MRAIVQSAYGSPAVLELKEIDTPLLQDDGVLVRVHAAAVHAGDYFIMRGVPYPVRFVAGWPNPKNYVPGFDVAGHVEAVGKRVTQLSPGDEVFGMCGRACAEYAHAPAATFLLKPKNLTFEQAAAVPTSAFAALHGLRNAGKVQPGQKVLINGASGGVGTFAVQIAKSLGAEVTGVCSTRNLDMVRSIGADHVIDYTQEDFTRAGQTYDLILDNVGNRRFSDCRRALTPKGIHIPNSGHAGIGYAVKALLRSAFVPQQGRPYLSKPNNEDLVLLKELIESGRLTPVVDRAYPLRETPDAIGFVGEGTLEVKSSSRYEIVSTDNPCGPTAACSGRRCAPPLMLSVGRTSCATI